MEKNKWPHAYTINGSKVQIEDAIKGIEYFNFRGEPMILKDGDIKVKHFAVKSEMDLDRRISARYEKGTNHDLLIDEIRKLKVFDIEEFSFHPSGFVTEKMTTGNYIPDITFYDQYGDILCIVEVVVTHKCEADKIEYLKQNNILTIELIYDRDEEDYKNYKRVKIFGSKELENFRRSRDMALRKFSEVQKIRKQFEEFREQSDRNKELYKHEIESLQREVISTEEEIHGQLRINKQAVTTDRQNIARDLQARRKKMRERVDFIRRKGRDRVINGRTEKAGELLSGVRQAYYQRGIEALEAQLNARGIHNEPGV